ncbi:oligosaccharide flippase family protein [bacterium]|nr:oligosaccharide flippase family protein [bacterium]
MIKIPKFITQIFTTYLARSLAMALGTITTIAVARTLGPEGRGYIATATTLAGMGTIIGCVGLPQINAYYGAKMPKLRAKLLGNSLAVSALVTLILALLFYLGSSLAPSLICLPGLLLPLTVLYAGLLLAVTLIQQLMVGMDLVRQYNWTELAIRGLQLLGIAALAWWGYRQAVPYFASSALAFLPVIIYGIYVCAKHIDERLSVSWKLWRRTAAYSSRLYIIALCFNIFMGLDIIMTNKYLGTEQTGIFSIAASMRQILLVFTNVIQTLLLPRLVVLKTFAERTQTAKSYTVLTAASTSVISVLTLLTADILVLWLFGAEFVPCTSALYIMLPGYILYSVATVLAVIMQAEGQPWSSVAPMLLALLCHGVLCVICIPQFGIQGGAISYSGSCCLYLLAQVTVNTLHGRKKRAA